MKTLEVSVPDDLHARIQRIAKEEAKPAKEVVRRAISAGLALRERRKRHQTILAYARRVAGSRQDLDADLESASLQCLQLLLDDKE